MNALQYTRPNKLSMVEKPVPGVGENEVLIEVAFAGICGTDIHIIAEESPAADRVILGHEFSGTVAAVGNGVDNLKKGNRVAVDPNNFCGKCHYCRRGKVHFCENLEPVGVFRDGAWAQYCTVPAGQVHLLPKEIALEWGALGEPLSCILHGWDRIQPLNQNIDILIIGSGLVGLLWGLLLRSYGFRQVLVSEPKSSRRMAAESLNFQTVRPEELNDKSRQTDKRFDLIIDCSGNPRAIEQAFQLIKPIGKLLLFGVSPKDSYLQINPFQVFKKELTILGSVINPFCFSRALHLIADIQMPIEELGITFYALEDYQRAIDEIKTGKAIKGVFRIK